MTDSENIYSHQTSTGTSKPSSTIKTTTILFVVVGILALIGSFAAGVQYQKSKTPARLAGNFSTNGAFGEGFGRGGRQLNGSFGSVTAVSTSSITVQDQRSGSTKTYTINASTSISKDGSTANASDIATGDTVMVQTSGSTSTTATRIVINPSFDGPSTQTQSDDGSGGTTDSSSI